MKSLSFGGVEITGQMGFLSLSLVKDKWGKG